MPVVLINAQPHPSILTVNLDPAPGLIEAVTHLASLGHREIVWLGKKLHGKSADVERLGIYRTACRKNGLKLLEHEFEDVATFSSIDVHLRHYRSALGKLTFLSKGVSAAVCYNDTIALSLSAVLTREGIRVPEDFSIIGFDDLHAVYASPALTTISHSLDRIGAVAAKLAIEKSTGSMSSKKKLWKVPSRLIVRETVSRPHQNYH